MKIATFNVNGIKSRLPRLLEWLEESAPDVVCLQELKTTDETFPEAAIRAAGYGALWSGQKSFNGVARPLMYAVAGAGGYAAYTSIHQLKTLNHPDPRGEQQ